MRDYFKEPGDKAAPDHFRIKKMFTDFWDWYNDGDDDGTSGFDPTFVESLNSQFDRKGYLTEAQETALQNILDKWVES